MTTTLIAPVEALVREQVANGHFPSMDRGLEAAVRIVFGRMASHALESLLDEARRAAFSGKRLAEKDRKTAGPIFYPPSFTSSVSREFG